MEVSGQINAPAALPAGFFFQVPGLDAVGKKTICFAGGRTRATQLVSSRYTDWALPAPSVIWA
jgi:hypothetical protein